MEANDIWDPEPPAAGGRNNNNNNNNNNNEDDDVDNNNNNNNNAVVPPAHEEAIMNNDGSYEGGVASGGGVEGPNANSSSCDIVLFMECTEKIDVNPTHPMLQPNVTVSIGLDKNTKLSSVFHRYCEFLNEHSPQATTKSGGRSAAVVVPPMEILPSDLEFVHCTLLYPNDTAEASALMKNDKIKVRRVRTAERETLAEQRRYQRESDREYFKQLRFLVPDVVGNKTGDVVLDCQGKLVDEHGLNQEVLRTTVRGHSALLAKRCKWLGRAIQCAKEEMERRSVITIPENEPSQQRPEDDEQEPRNLQPSPPPPPPQQQQPQDSSQQQQQQQQHNRVVSNEDQLPPPPPAEDDDDDDDDGIEVLPYPINQNNHPQNGVARRGGDSRNDGLVGSAGVAAEIENDEDEDEDVVIKQITNNNDDIKRAPSPVLSNANTSNLLWVTLPNHPPEAVKLLLEHCCTNRVIPLGHDAFMESCRTKPESLSSHNKHHHHQQQQQHLAPVSPFHHHHHHGHGHHSSQSASCKRWPNNGLPTVSFPVALSGISLAEEASMPRLSLMCEVAAAQLVTHSNFVEALSACSIQQSRTGNSLPRLRRAAMDILLRSGGKRGVETLCSRPTFQRALEERSFAVVPSLLNGTMEAITAEETSSKSANSSQNQNNTTKRELTADTQNYFEKFDKDDCYRRETERRKRRVERWKERGEIPPEYEDFTFTPDHQIAARITANQGMFSTMDNLWLENNDGMLMTQFTKNTMKRMSHHGGIDQFVAALEAEGCRTNSNRYLSTCGGGGGANTSSTTQHLFRPLARARSRSGGSGGVGSGSGGHHHQSSGSHHQHHNTNNNRTGRRSGRRN